MLRSRWRYLIFAAIVAALLGGGLYAAGRVRPKVVPAGYPPSSLDVRAWATDWGELHFEAKAQVRIHHKERSIVWWAVEVRRYREGGGPADLVWSHDYKDEMVAVGQPTAVWALRDRPVDLVLPELRVPGGLPVGDYHVFIGVKEDTPKQYPDGRIVDRVLIGKSAAPVEVR